MRNAARVEPQRLQPISGDGGLPWPRLPGLASLTVLALCACGGGDGTTAPPAVTIEIQPPHLEVNVDGDQQILTAVVKGADGKVLAGAPVAWSAADSTIVQLLTPSGPTCTVRAKRAGDVQVAAESYGRSGLATVAALGSVASISISPEAAHGVAGRVMAFSTALKDAVGHSLTGRVVTWRSSDPSVATIDSAGAASLLTAGTTRITASSGAASSSVDLSVDNPLPAIDSISPSHVTAGSGGLNVRVLGSGFVRTSSARWNDSARVVTYVGPSELRVQVLSADVSAPRDAHLVIANPPPGGGTSNDKIFQVEQPGPSISSLSPTSVTAGAAAFTLTVRGLSFLPGSKVGWNGAERPTTYASATELEAAISAADVALPGTVAITVITPPPGGGTSRPADFVVNPPTASVPTLTALSPTGAVLGGSAFTLTVRGAHFLARSVVRWNGSERSTTYVDSTQMQAAIPAADIAQATTAQVTVFTSAPGGGESTALQFPVAPPNPSPTISALTPASAVAGSTPLSLTVDGSGFIASSVVRWKGTDRPTTFVGAARLTAQISAPDLAAADSAQVQVFNPAPGGGTSPAAKFIVYGGLLGQVVSGTLASPATVDQYTFTAVAGLEVNVFFQSRGGALVLELLGPTGGSLGTIYSYGSEPTLEGQNTGRLRLTAGGTYTVKVRSGNNSDSGPYRFQVFPINRSPEQIPAAFTVGTIVTGEEISPPGDIDEFTFTAAAGTEVNVFFQNTGGTSSALTLDLISPSGSTLGSTWSYGGDPTLIRQNTGRLRLGTTGTYTVRVYGSSSSYNVGPYRFQVVPISRAPENIGSTVTVGSIVSGEDISPPGDIDEFTFTATAGMEVNVFFQNTSGTYSTLALALLDPSGSTMATAYSYAGDQTLERQNTGRIRLPTAGTYTLRVYGSSSSSDVGSYRFQVFQINRAPEHVSATFALGSTVTGEDISPVGDVDEFTFSGAAGVKVTASFQDLASSGGSLVLELLSPSGSSMGTIYSYAGDSAYRTGTFTLSTTGTYTVRVYGSSSSYDSGPYQFQVK